MLLDLFPIPRRYARVPGALAVALVVALVTVYLNERTPLAAGLLVAGVVVLILVYVIRARQKKEWIAFFQEENRRLHYEIIQLKATEAVRKEQAASNQRNE